MIKGKRRHFRFKMMRIAQHLRHKLGRLGAALRPRQDPNGDSSQSVWYLPQALSTTMCRSEMAQHNTMRSQNLMCSGEQVIFSMCECIDVWRLILRYQIPIEEKQLKVYILFHSLIESVVDKEGKLSTRTSTAFPE